MINLLFVKYRGIKGNDTKEVVINTKKLLKNLITSLGQSLSGIIKFFILLS